MSRKPVVSRKGLADLLEALPDPTLIVATNGQIELANQSAEALFGYSKQELLGLTVEELMPQHLRLAHASHRATYHGAPHARAMGMGAELLARRKNGDSFPVHIALSPARADEQDITICAVRDLSERRQVERAMELANQHRQLFEAAVRDTDDAVLITDADLDLPGPRIIFVNRAFTQMTGYEQNEVLGKTPRILQGPATDRAIMERLRRELGEGRTFRGETINYRKDGSPFWIQWSISPILDRHGTTTHFVAVQRDTTANHDKEHRAEEALRFLQATIDALAAHVAVLDPNGKILAVNAAWRQSGQDNGGGAQDYVGWSYLRLCAIEEGGETALRVAQGVRQVIMGEREEIYLEYPCLSPLEERWFALRVTPFAEPPPRRAVIAHANITERRLAAFQLHHRLIREQLTAELSRRFINEPAERGDKAIAELLEPVCKALDADCAHIVLFDESSLTLRSYFSYERPDLPQEKRLPDDRWWAALRGDPESATQIRRYLQIALKEISNGEPFAARSPEAIGKSRELGDLLGSHPPIHSLICVPILRNQRMMGYLSVFWIRQALNGNQGEELFLQTIAEILASALTRWRGDRLFRSIVEGISASTGEAFLGSLTQQLCKGLEVDYAVISEIVDKDHLRALAFQAYGEAQPTFDFPRTGTPCAEVIASKELCLYQSETACRFPQQSFLRELQVEAYAGMPLFDTKGQIMGVMAVMHRKPFEAATPVIDVLRVFAARAASEIERRRKDDELRAWNQTLERRVAERAAEVSRQAAAMDSTMEGMAILDGDRYIYMNDAHAKMYGYESGQSLLGRTWRELYEPDQIKHVEENVLPIVAREGRYAGEVVGKRRDGSTFDVAISLTLTTSGDLIHCCEDITEQKRIQTELQKNRDELKAANAELARAVRLKDEFLASMSHELRTPLNAILGMTEVLLDGMLGKLSERQASSLKIVDESGRHLLSLINDILDLSKIEAGALKLAFERVSIPDLVEAALRIVRPAAQAKGHDVKARCEPSIGEIDADERRLKQILVNLLDNAIKFTPKGGKIEVEAQRDSASNEVVFTVSDTGPGIAASDMGLLFKPFMQLERGATKQHAGTGLGLSLVKRLAEMHHGSVAVQSTPGQGCRFTVRVPEAPFTKRQLAAHDKPASTRLGAAAMADAPHGHVVLLVDDDEPNIRLLRRYLTLKGFIVIARHNGAEALDVLRHDTEGISAVLMDIQMPGMNGFEAIQTIRSKARYAKLPIIAMTALAMPKDRDRCLEAGATAYVTKPLSLKDLEQKLHQLIQEKGE